MKSRILRLVGFFSAAIVLPSVASACMVCDNELGRQIQHGVFDGHFLSTAATVLLPFPLFLLAGAAARFAAPKIPSPDSEEQIEK